MGLWLYIYILDALETICRLFFQLSGGITLTYSNKYHGYAQFASRIDDSLRAYLPVRPKTFIYMYTHHRPGCITCMSPSFSACDIIILWGQEAIGTVAQDNNCCVVIGYNRYCFRKLDKFLIVSSLYWL